MKSHFYLLRTSLKNRFKELLRKPGKLILYILLLLSICGAMVASLFGATHNGGQLPISYLLGIFFAFLLLFYFIAIQKGLASGDTIFEMNDVNLLFVSPVNPRLTLLYGLIRLAGMSFWAGFFILFQSGTLANFGVGFNGVLIFFGVFILHMIVLTMLSIVMYSATSGNPGHKKIARIIAIAVFIPLLMGFASYYTATGDILLSLNAILVSPVFAATPFVGWASAGAIALIEGNLAYGFGLLGLLVLSGVGMLLYIMFSKSDYYEDVLVAAETSFEKKRAASEGNVQTAASINAKATVKKTGLGGKGARVFLYKHLRETFRQNRFGFFSINMLITAACVIAASLLFFKEDGIITVLQVLMWIQVFMIGTGRGMLELYSHYLFMVPSSPFQKALWSNMELVARTLAESILYLGIPGLIMGSNPLVILGSMAVYTLFSLMLLGVNYLSMRYTGANISQGLLLTIYLIAVMLFIAPGLAAALFVGFSRGGLIGTLLGLLILSAWELVVALGCFALSKNVLHNCDMPSTKQK